MVLELLVGVAVERALGEEGQQAGVLLFLLGLLHLDDLDLCLIGLLVFGVFDKVGVHINTQLLNHLLQLLLVLLRIWNR